MALGFKVPDSWHWDYDLNVSQKVIFLVGQSVLVGRHTYEVHLSSLDSILQKFSKESTTKFIKAGHNKIAA